MKQLSLITILILTLISCTKNEQRADLPTDYAAFLEGDYRLAYMIKDTFRWGPHLDSFSSRDFYCSIKRINNSEIAVTFAMERLSFTPDSTYRNFTIFFTKSAKLIEDSTFQMTPDSTSSPLFEVPITFKYENDSLTIYDILYWQFRCDYARHYRQTIKW